MSATRGKAAESTKAASATKRGSPSRSPTPTERRALVVAYSEDYSLSVHEPGDVGGFRVKTLRGLVDAGWLEAPDLDEADHPVWEDAPLTAAGREALGLPRRAPRSFRAAFEQAIEVLFRVSLPADAVLRGSRLPSMVLDEDTDFFMDTSAVRAALEVASLGLDADTPDEAAAERIAATWGAVAARMREAGHPVELALEQGYVLVYADEG